MIPWFEAAARRLQRHPTDSDFVLYLDGELNLAGLARLESHCRACWTCRQRLDEIQRGIHDYVEYRNRELSGADPGGQLRSRFMLRLASAEAAFADPPRARSFPRLAWAAPALAAMLAGGWLAVRSLHPPVVSASALIQQAVRTERAQARNQGPIGRLRVARLENGTWSTGFVPLAPASLSVPRPAVLENLAALLREHDLTGHVGLSPAQFEFWAAKLKAQLEVRQIRIAGVEHWLISAHVARAGNGLQSFSLLLRAADKLPIEQRFHFLCDGARVSFVICPEPFQLPAVTAAPAPLRRPSASPALVLRAPRGAADALAEGNRLAELAVEARYLLHETGFDLSGAVGVARDTATVRIRGVVETQSDRSLLVRAFAGQPSIRVEVSVSQDSVLRSMPERTDLAVVPDADGEQALFRKSADQFLRPLIASGLGDEEAYKRIEDFGRQAIHLSSRTVQLAWALRRLYRDFKPAQIDLLSPAHRLLLRDLSAEYESGAQQTLTQLAAHLRPVLAASHGPSDVPSGALTDIPERIDQLTRILFAGLPPGRQPLSALLIELSALLSAVPGDLAARHHAWLAMSAAAPDPHPFPPIERPKP